MKNYIILFLLNLLILISCSDKKHKYKIDKNFNYTVLKHPWLKVPSFTFRHGLSDIVTKEYVNDTLLYLHSCELCLTSFIKNDTVTIYYENPDCFITFDIYKDSYSLELEYITDIANEYKSGNKITGYLNLKPLNEQLILSKSDYKLNDTICGYFELETPKFLKRKYSTYNEYCEQYDKISGSFISIIKDKNDKEPYFIP